MQFFQEHHAYIETLRGERYRLKANARLGLARAIKKGVLGNQGDTPGVTITPRYQRHYWGHFSTASDTRTLGRIDVNVEEMGNCFQFGSVTNGAGEGG